MSTTESPAKPFRRLTIDISIVIDLPDDRPSMDYVRAAHNYLMDQPRSCIHAWPVGRDVNIKVAQTSANEYAAFEPAPSAYAVVEGHGHELKLLRLQQAEPPEKPRFAGHGATIADPQAEPPQGSLL
jgi:hypothetical protein